MAHITLLGKDFPIEYTISVMEAVAKKFGGTAEASEALTSMDSEDQLHATVFMLAEMMKGAEKRERVRCSLWGEEFKGVPALDYETLLSIMNPDDLRNMADAIFSTINASSEQTMEVAPSKKNQEEVS